MLIINADDFGLSKQHTDRVLDCFHSGRVSSATIMVFMEDTERAFSLAKKSNLRLGLHLNLDTQFSASSVNDDLISAHHKLSNFFQSSNYSSIIYNFKLRMLFRKTFTSQFNEFCQISQSPPSHIDGHHHFHLSPNIVFNRILPKGIPLRRNFTFKHGEKLFLNRWYRAFINWKISKYHPLTNCFFSLCDIIEQNRIEEINRLARTKNVEMNTHPINEHEFNFLMSDSFYKLVKNVRLGTYADLLK